MPTCGGMPRGSRPRLRPSGVATAPHPRVPRRFSEVAAQRRIWYRLASIANRGSMTSNRPGTANVRLTTVRSSVRIRRAGGRSAGVTATASVASFEVMFARLPVLLVAALLPSSLCAQEPPAPPVDPGAELARVVDLPDPGARAKAALELSHLDVSIDGWLDAMRAFAPPDRAAPGEGRETVPLWNGKALEDTEVDWLVPPGVTFERPVPLMLVAHGTGGSGHGLCGMWREVAGRLGMVVIAPSESGQNEGYAYSDRERAVTLSAIRWARRRFDVDEDRVFLSGISRGGHLTWDVALRFPDRFAAIAPMIGGPRLNPSEAQNNLRYLENVVQLPIRDLQGSQDDPALLFNLHLAFERLAKLSAVDAKLVEFPDQGHSFDFTAVDWVSFLAGVRRNAVPQRVVRMTARNGEGRAFWVDVLATDPRAVKETFRLRVQAAEWNALDDGGRRRFLADAADEHTARLAARLVAPGAIELEARDVRRVRLLLTEEMLDPDGRLAVTVGSRTRKFRPKPDAAVLLGEFVERFDRRFLPVAEVTLRP